MLPVGENDRLVGRVTDRDIGIRLVGEGRDPACTKVRDVMTAEVRYVYEDERVRKAKQLGIIKGRHLEEEKLPACAAAARRPVRLLGIDVPITPPEAGERLGRGPDASFWRRH